MTEIQEIQKARREKDTEMARMIQQTVRNSTTQATRQRVEYAEFVNAVRRQLEGSEPEPQPHNLAAGSGAQK